MDRGDNVYKIDLSAISFQILSKNVLFYLTDVTYILGGQTDDKLGGLISMLEFVFYYSGKIAVDWTRSLLLWLLEETNDDWLVGSVNPRTGYYLQKISLLFVAKIVWLLFGKTNSKQKEAVNGPFKTTLPGFEN